MKKICIVTSGHPPFDERIYWKFALSLKENGYNTAVICSTQNIELEENGVFFKGFNDENLNKSEKITKLHSMINSFQPDKIICCEPLTILAAAKYRAAHKTCRIFYDVTEWYPENVSHKLNGIQRLKTYIMLSLFNIYAVNKADGIIIGEPAKKRRYDRIAPFKRKQIVSYYPVLKYFNFSGKRILSDLVLGYAGLISVDRGVNTLIRAAAHIASDYPALKVKVKLAGRFSSADEEKEIMYFATEYKNIDVKYAGSTTYNLISDLLADMHICFDLRKRDFIYNNSLPIKIFEYMAAGKPFIFSDIKPIREAFDYHVCGQLVNPDNIDDICHAISKYLKDRNLLYVHSVNGRKLVEKEFNWESESAKLIRILDRI